MRQVPHYLIIGNGRVASHFQAYFSLLQCSFSSWHRSEPISKLQTQIKSCSHILVLIKDNAIEDFILQHLTNSAALVIHFSGSLVTEYAYGAHPLMTFGKDLYTLEQYQAIPFVIDQDCPDFKEIFPAFVNPHARLDKANKARYHALCVLSGNFSCMLWQKFFKTLEEEFNLPLEMGHPYFLQQTQNILTNPKTALTGPLVRNDTQTIQKNLAALTDDPFQKVYQSFVNCFQQTEGVNS